MTPFFTGLFPTPIKRDGNKPNRKAILAFFKDDTMSISILISGELCTSLDSIWSNAFFDLLDQIDAVTF
jgi:hypothetical protein